VTLKKKNKKANKVRLLKVATVEPNKHIVELEIEDPPVPPPVATVVEPVVLSAPEEGVHGNAFVDWLKKIF
jgi:hypothetical protein